MLDKTALSFNSKGELGEEMKSVVCSLCSGYGKIYAGSSFVTCGGCGGQGNVLKNVQQESRFTGKPATGGSSGSSGQGSLGGIILLGGLGYLAYIYATETALPALLENWPWVIWHIVSLSAAFCAVVFRALEEGRKGYVYEFALGAILAIKVGLPGFWASSGTGLPSLASLFVIGCLLSSVVLLVSDGLFKSASRYSIYEPFVVTLQAYLAVLAIIVFSSLLFGYSWGGGIAPTLALLGPFIPPVMALSFAPCLAFAFRGARNQRSRERKRAKVQRKL